MSAPGYDSYKESGVEGVGAIPTHWQMERLSHRVRTCRDMILPTELVGREVYHYSIPVVQLTGEGRIEDGTEIDSAKLLIEAEMLLVSKLNPRKATMCVARPKGVLTVASSEFVPLIPANVDLGYLCFAAASAQFRTRLESRVESATKSHQRVTPSDILQTPWPFPPLTEQTAIAAFLDRETGKIDALVEAQTRLIDLLKEATVEQMLAWTAEPRRLNRIPFGKHRGKPWSEPPEDYLRWMAGQEDMDADVVAAARQEIARRAGGVTVAMADADDAS